MFFQVHIKNGECNAGAGAINNLMKGVYYRYDGSQYIANTTVSHGYN